MASSMSMIPLQRRAEVTSWYLDENLSTLLSPADQAYAQARDFFTSQVVPPDDRAAASRWLSGHTTLSDFQTTMTNLQTSLDSKSLAKSSKPRQWLASCSERVAFYGSVMDALVQHHPEYVSLAWGAFKFLFTAVLNYEQLLKAVAKAFVRIADVLPRTELHLRLYTTNRMLFDVARIYASILDFVRRATEWYSKNRLQRSLSAIIKPLEISFKDIIDEIGTCSRRVDEHANAAMKAELRDLHIEMMQIRESTNASLAQIRFDIHSQTQHFMNNQRLQILSLVSRSTDPDPIASLESYRSLMRRRRAHVVKFERRRGNPWPDSLTSALQALAAASTSRILLLKASHFIAPAQDAVVDIVDLVLDAKVPVFWVMGQEPQDHENAPIFQVADVFRALLAQILAKHPDADAFKADAPFPLTPAHVQMAAADPSQWPDILARAVSNVAPQVFVVVECSTLLAHDDTASHVQDLVAQLEKACAATLAASSSRTRVKVVIADRQYLHRLQEGPLSANVNLVVVDPRRNVSRIVRAPRGRAQSSHAERTRAVQSDKVVFEVATTTPNEAEEEEDEWV